MIWCRSRRLIISDDILEMSYILVMCSYTTPPPQSDICTDRIPTYSDLDEALFSIKYTFPSIFYCGWFFILFFFAFQKISQRISIINISNLILIYFRTKSQKESENISTLIKQKEGQKKHSCAALFCFTIYSRCNMSIWHYIQCSHCVWIF